jgi:hypothetical protein
LILKAASVFETLKKGSQNATIFAWLESSFEKRIFAIDCLVFLWSTFLQMNLTASNRHVGSLLMIVHLSFPFSTFIFLFSSNCVLQVATQQQSVTMSQIYSGVGGGRALESNDREVHVLQLSTVCAAHCGHGVLQETRVGELALLTKGGSNSESGTSVPARFRLWLFFFSAAKGTLPRSPTHLFPDPVHCRKWRSSSFLASLQLFAFLHAYHHFFRLPHIRLPVTPSDPACSNMHMERQVEKG